MKKFKFVVGTNAYHIDAMSFAHAALEMDKNVMPASAQNPWSWRMDENGIYRQTYD